MRTTKMQISLDICEVWSASLLFPSYWHSFWSRSYQRLVMVKLITTSVRKRNKETCLKWKMLWENMFMSYAKNKDADQSTHLHSLISVFVIHCPLILLLFTTYHRLVPMYCITTSVMKRNKPQHDKPTKWTVRPAKTQICLGIHPVWSVLAVRFMGR